MLLAKRSSDFVFNVMGFLLLVAVAIEWLTPGAWVRLPLAILFASAVILWRDNANRSDYTFTDRVLFTMTPACLCYMITQSAPW